MYYLIVSVAKILVIAFLGLCSGSHRATGRCWPGLHSHVESQWGELFSKLIWDVGRIQFLVAL